MCLYIHNLIYRSNLNFWFGGVILNCVRAIFKRRRWPNWMLTTSSKKLYLKVIIIDKMKRSCILLVSLCLIICMPMSYNAFKTKFILVSRKSSDCIKLSIVIGDFQVIILEWYIAITFGSNWTRPCLVPLSLWLRNTFIWEVVIEQI